MALSRTSDLKLEGWSWPCPSSVDSVSLSKLCSSDCWACSHEKKITFQLSHKLASEKQTTLSKSHKACSLKAPREDQMGQPIHPAHLMLDNANNIGSNNHNT